MNQSFKPFLRQNYWKSDVHGAAENLLQRLHTEQKTLHVVTLTSEMVLHAIKNPEVMSAILSSDFIVADTISLTFWLKTNKIPVCRVTGIDLAEQIIRHAQKPRVGIIGGVTERIRAKAAEKINDFGGIVSVTNEGPRIFSYTTADDAEIIAELNEKKPQIILVAFGHGKQEWWISKIKKQLSFPAIIIGVGGTIDVWGGEFTRAPHFVRAVGFEWFWRLIQEPKRVRRIIDAVIVFPYRAFLENLL